MRPFLFAAAAVVALSARANIYITPVATATVNGRVYVTTTLVRNSGVAAVKCQSAYALPDDPKGGSLRASYLVEAGAIHVDEGTLMEAAAVGTLRFDCAGSLLIAVHMQASSDGGKTFDPGRFFRAAGEENALIAGNARSIQSRRDLLMMEVNGKQARALVIVKDRQGRVLGRKSYDILPFGEQIVNLSAVRATGIWPVIEISLSGSGAIVITPESDDASLIALFKRNTHSASTILSDRPSAIQQLTVSPFKAAPFVEPLTGLIYMRDRWYDPHTGSFLSPDRAGYRDSANLYSFCGGDPVNCSDPTGQISLKAALTDKVISEYEMRTLVLSDEEIRTIIGSQNVVKLAGSGDPERVKLNIMRAKFVLLARNQAFKQYTGQLYELTRGLNPIQFAAETGWAIGAGQDLIEANRVNRGDKVLELATYLAFMKGTDFVLGRLRAGALSPRIVPARKPPFVIGEGMKSRVIPYANEIGAEYYAPKNVPSNQWMEHNRQVIRRVIEEGRQIIDIGPNPSRLSYPDPTSPYYAMEVQEIARARYKNYVRLPDEPERLATSNAH